MENSSFCRVSRYRNSDVFQKILLSLISAKLFSLTGGFSFTVILPTQSRTQAGINQEVVQGVQYDHYNHSQSITFSIDPV